MTIFAEWTGQDWVVVISAVFMGLGGFVTAVITTLRTTGQFKALSNKVEDGHDKIQTEIAVNTAISARGTASITRDPVDAQVANTATQNVQNKQIDRKSVV